MRITFVLPCYPWRPIGAFRVVYEYANQLVARGHQVSVVHARRMRDDKGFYAPRNLYRRLRRRVGYLRDSMCVPKVRWQEIDSRVQMLYVREPGAEAIPDADAVFASAWDTVQYVCRYPAAKGNKFHLVQSYDYWSQLEGEIEVAWRLQMNKVVISKWLCEKMGDLRCSNFAYIPNGINQEQFRLLKPIAERPKRVVMLYATAECKGSKDGLRALLIARKKHSDLRAVLFGIPKRPRNLPTWIEYFQNPTQYDLIHNIYNGSSVYLCSSLKEASPLPPAEAMSCGCALVTTDCGGTAEYAAHGTTALFSPPRSPAALAENLVCILEDSGLRIKLAEEGYRCMQGMGWVNSTTKLVDYICSRRNEGHAFACVSAEVF